MRALPELRWYYLFGQCESWSPSDVHLFQSWLAVPSSRGSQIRVLFVLWHGIVDAIYLFDLLFSSFEMGIAWPLLTELLAIYPMLLLSSLENFGRCLLVA